MLVNRPKIPSHLEYFAFILQERLSHVVFAALVGSSVRSACFW